MVALSNQHNHRRRCPSPQSQWACRHTRTHVLDARPRNIRESTRREELDDFGHLPLQCGIHLNSFRRERKARIRVSASIANPGGPRVLWCLRRRKSDVRCVLYSALKPVEVQILQERDLVLKELFAEESSAVEWAREYGARLRRQGWRDSPEDCSPSSAA